MAPLTDRTLVLVTQPTRVDELKARFNTLDQARFYVEHLGASFDDYLAEHTRYAAAVGRVEAHLRALGRVHPLPRRFLPTYVFGPDDTVVVVGRDGLVANALKYLPVQPVLGVNPDPARWDGVLLPFGPDDVPGVLPDVLAGRRPLREVTLAEAVLSDGQRLRAVNDLFVGPKTHVSARYVLRDGGREETQSSSGVIVSTGLGSTGWFRSLMTGAEAVAAARAGAAPGPPAETTLPWEARTLFYTVREPFPSRTTGTALVYGRIEEGGALELVSQMPEHGVVFSDGVEADFLAFNAGTTARIGLAAQRGHLVV